MYILYLLKREVINIFFEQKNKDFKLEKEREV